MTNPPSLLLADDAATTAAGACLAAEMAGHELITLSGDLGAGKTTLCRGLIRALGHSGAVKSPTFTLVETYDIRSSGPTLHLAHFDLYRLSDPEELEFMGIRDYLDGTTVCLVEWPEKGTPLLPRADLALTLTHEGRQRRLTWQTASVEGEKLGSALTRLAKAASDAIR